MLQTANYQKNVTLNLAKGDAASIMKEFEANAEAFKKVQSQTSNACFLYVVMGNWKRNLICLKKTFCNI